MCGLLSYLLKVDTKEENTLRDDHNERGNIVIHFTFPS